MKLLHLLLALVVVLVSCSFTRTAAAVDSAVVTIVSRTDQGSAMGSGFLFSADGKILTCYHVIERAQSLQVYRSSDDVAGGQDVIVVGIAPQFDIAILQVTRFAGKPYLTLLTDRSPAAGDEVQIHGAAARVEQQQFSAYVTRGPLMSGAIQGTKGERIFEKADVSIIPLQATVYDGLSGGPVIFKGRVLGLLSGSLDEGGTIAWAIPASYVKSVNPIKKRVADMIWPPLGLMRSSWKNLRKAVTSLAPALSELDAYLGSVVALEAAQDNYIASLTKIRVEYRLLSGVLPANGFDEGVEVFVHRLERASTQLEVSQDALYKAIAAATQRMAGLAARLQVWDQQVPYIPENLPTLRTFEGKMNAAQANLVRIRATAELVDTNAVDYARRVAKAISAARTPAQWIAAVKKALQDIESLDWAALQQNLAARAAAYRAVGAATQVLVQADLIPFGRPWNYLGPSRIRLQFPAGYWESDGRVDPSFVKGARQEYAAKGLTYEHVFPNWLDRVPGVSSPRATLILSTRDAAGASVQVLETTLRGSDPAAEITTQTMGSKVVLVQTLPMSRPENVLLRMETIEGNQIVRFEFSCDRSGVAALMPQFRGIVASTQRVRRGPPHRPLQVGAIPPTQ